MSEIKTNELLSQLQMLARQVQQGSQGENSEALESSGGVEFSKLIEDSIKSVNDQNMKAADTAKAFELNDPDVPLSEVMIEMQKARVSFEALKQVRNQLVDAYKQVMNMPL